MDDAFGDGKTNQFEFSTRDLYLAAFLTSKNVNIIRFDTFGKDSRGKSPIYFIFDDVDRCKELEQEFWSGVGDGAMVNVKDFHTNLRELRARMAAATSPNRY